MKHTKEEYSCDNCGKELDSPSSLDIVTSKREASIGWSRLHVRIEHVHGAHNDYDTEHADLCKKCTIALLTDALRRAKMGERASKGTESCEQNGW